LTEKLHIAVAAADGQHGFILVLFRKSVQKSQKRVLFLQLRVCFIIYYLLPLHGTGAGICRMRRTVSHIPSGTALAILLNN
jgi:hypothetical protein